MRQRQAVVWLAVLLASGAARAQCKLSRTGDMTKPEGIVVLENAHIRIEIAPARGGRVTRLLYKPAAREMVHMADVGQGAGLLLDVGKRVWKAPYDVEIVESSPDRVAVKLKRLVVTKRGRASEVLVQKTVDLQRGRNSVLVSYEFSNRGDETALFSFRLTNVLSPGGGKAPSRELAFPYGCLADRRAVNVSGRPKGRHTRVYRLTDETSVNHWVMEPARTWMGVRDPGGIGVAMEMDFPYVDICYSWFPSTQYGTGYPTSEVFYRPVELRPFVANPDETIMDPGKLGNVWKQTVRFVPFASLPRFDGCSNGFVAGIEAHGSRVRVHCGTARDFAGTLQVLIREPAAMATREIGSAPVKLSAGRESAVRVPV